MRLLRNLLRNLFASGNKIKSAVNLFVTGVLAIVAFSFAWSFFTHGCSEEERGSLAAFSHYGDRQPSPSTTDATGSCTLRYTASGTEGEILGYYRENLSERGWDVEVEDPPTLSQRPKAERREATEGGAEYTALDSLRAEREGYAYTVRFYKQSGSSEADPQRKRVVVSIFEDRGLRYFLNSAWD